MINQVFGKRLREIRHGMKLSQYAFGNMVGLSSGQISDYEKGRDLKLSQIEKIANGLNIPIEKLIGDDTFIPAEPDGQINEMLTIAKHLTPESKAIVINLMKGMLRIQK